MFACYTQVGDLSGFTGPPIGDLLIFIDQYISRRGGQSGASNWSPEAGSQEIHGYDLQKLDGILNKGV